MLFYTNINTTDNLQIGKKHLIVYDSFRWLEIFWQKLTPSNPLGDDMSQ